LAFQGTVLIRVVVDPLLRLEGFLAQCSPTGELREDLLFFGGGIAFLFFEGFGELDRGDVGLDAGDFSPGDEGVIRRDYMIAVFYSVRSSMPYSSPQVLIFSSSSSGRDSGGFSGGGGLTTVSTA
jgi:hypothetical protein